MKISSAFFSKVAVYLFIILGVVIFLVPLFFLVIWSSYDNQGIFSFPPKLVPGSNLIENFRMLQVKINVFRALFNSSFITVISVIGQVFFASLAGFAFAKYAFKGKTILFAVLIGTMAIPFQALVVPLYIMMQKLNLGNTYAGVILPTLAPAFAIFLMRQNVKQIVSNELMDAARVDGATEFGIYFRIALPILKPSLAALAVILFLMSWNNFFWPLIILRTQNMLVITVALANMVQPPGSYTTTYGALMLGSSISMIPVLVFFSLFQKHFIRGITAGSFR